MDINNTACSSVQTRLDKRVVLGPGGSVQGASERRGEDLPSDRETEDVHSLRIEVLHLPGTIDAAVLTERRN